MLTASASSRWLAIGDVLSEMRICQTGWELPTAARRVAATERYDTLIALGAVIRGDTPHFDYVAGEASRGLASASADFDVPIAFGVLTCDTMAQAEARAGGEHGNKGWDAALAALEMADLLDQVDGSAED